MTIETARRAAIRRSGRTIYDPIADDSDLWIPIHELEATLDTALTGTHLGDLPLRTRSKVAKQLVCKALGYPVPDRFRRTRPQFPGQRLDIYVQKTDNLQIWNDDIAPTRRYAIVRLNRSDVVDRVRVASGAVIAARDTTGTLTKKYQAKLVIGNNRTELIPNADTPRLQRYLGTRHSRDKIRSPVADPQAGAVMPIRSLYGVLADTLGTALPNVAEDQDRVRGMLLHKLVCSSLGYDDTDDGRFPDLRHQLLEIKLQTAPTIDLGAVCPDDTEPLCDLEIEGTPLRPCDIRYAIFHATKYGRHVLLTHLYVTNGRHFFTRFPKMQGRVVNTKIQIKLPSDFFHR